MTDIVKHSDKLIPDKLNNKLFSVIIICCLGFIIYSGTFFNSFHFDDGGSITGNFAIRNIRNLRDIWNFWPTRFLTYLSIAFNYSLGGYDVFGYHVFNLFVHLGSAVMVWCLTILTLNTPALKNDPISAYSGRIAFFAAVIFLSHPIQTQPVNYIIQRASLLSSFFYITSLCLYVKARLRQEERQGPHIWKVYYGSSLLCAVMGMFCKEIAISLPLAICLYEACFLRGQKGFGWKYAFPFLALVLVIPLTMLFARSVDFHEMRFVKDGVPGISSWHYFLTQTRVLVTYLRLLFVPVNQNLDYYYPASRSLFEWPVILSLLLLSAVISAGVRFFHKYRLLSFCVFWFFITLLLESSFFPIRDVIYEHRLYLPMAGFSLFLVGGLFHLTAGKRAWRVYAVLFLLIACYSAMAYQRNKVWQSDLALWDDAARKSPLKARPLVNRGLAYAKNDRFDLALADYDKAIEINPENAGIYIDRGLAYQNSGRLDLALADYNKAIELNPDYTEAYNNRGIVYAAKGDFDQAIADFLRSIEIDPGYANAYYNRGLAYQNKGRLDLALDDYNKAIRINPRYSDAYSNRAIVYCLKHQYDIAWEGVHKAEALCLQLNPDILAYLKKASGREK
ncbi:MAG: tetratricopeptide repeat protein [Candidatus Omnitrophota bacterium]